MAGRGNTVQTFDYTFRALPAPGEHSLAVVRLFSCYGPVTLTFTEADFDLFRQQLQAAGLVLIPHEITRVPHHDPETVR
jgi:hypothetical protein